MWSLSLCMTQHIYRFAGALHTHKSLRTQIEGLCQAWAWQTEDRILHALPLHHVHGIINALYCAHNNGACVEFLPKFSPDAVWQALKVGTGGQTGHMFCGVDARCPVQLHAYVTCATELWC